MKVSKIGNCTNHMLFTIFIMEKLVDTLRLLTYEVFLKTYYEKRKKVIKFFTNFYISYKSDIKIFLKWSINFF